MSNQNLSKALSALSAGEIIVYPTDTLYGLGADVFNTDAVKKVFGIKKRPFNQPISVAVSCKEELEEIAFLDKKVEKIIDIFLPGSLTIILKKKKVIHDIVTAGLDNVAIRIPDNKISLELLSDFGPLTCTSANISGQKTPETVKNIHKQFKDDVKVYIDGGCLNGKASTIVDATSNKLKILRQGEISKDTIMKIFS